MARMVADRVAALGPVARSWPFDLAPPARPRLRIVDPDDYAYGVVRIPETANFELQIFFNEALISAHTQDMRTITVELHLDGIFSDIDRGTACVKI